MSGWRLERDVIDGVLIRVEGGRERLSEAFSVDRLTEIDEDVVASGPVAADVRIAVGVLLNGQSARLTTITNRVDAAHVGVLSAVACYDAGQEEMLAQCQANMVASAGSGDFSWWYGSAVPVGAV